MPRGNKRRRGQGWPYGTSTQWTLNACDWWMDDVNSVTPDQFLVTQNNGSQFDLSTSVPWNGNGYIRYDGTTDACHTIASDQYFSTYGDAWKIDVWRALAAGAWSSSVVFTIKRRSRGFVTGPYSQTLYVGKFNCRANSFLYCNPAEQSVSDASQSATTNRCTDIATHTLTVYDDGTFSLA
jgi:hypothetical protein